MRDQAASGKWRLRAQRRRGRREGCETGGKRWQLLQAGPCVFARCTLHRNLLDMAAGGHL